MTINFEPPAADGKRIVERDLLVGQLCHSPHNCRRDVPSAENTAPLEEVLLVQGLRMPIEVHHMRGSGNGAKAKYGAFAGRRRYYSLDRLVTRGEWPADRAIRVKEYVGYTDAELVELSISENDRDDLKPHELYAAIARAHALGHDAATIARNIGNKDAVLVEQWLRLGKLAQPVFRALIDGEIDIARARAYAATEDHALQEQTFAALRRSRDLVHPVPAEIRKALKVGDRELNRLLAFVGPEVYRDAGGRYEYDLFAEEAEQRGRVVDEGKLRELASRKLDEARAAFRQAVGAPNLRFLPEPPQNGLGGTDFTLQHRPKHAEGEQMTVPDGVVAHIAIADSGLTDITLWWPSAAAKHGNTRTSAGKGMFERMSAGAMAAATRPGVPASQIFSRPAEGAALSTSEMHGGPSARREANAVLRDEAGLTADLIQVLRSQRRLILRARLVDAADRPESLSLHDAGDYLVWSQLRMFLGDGTSQSTGAAFMRGIDADPPETAEHLRAMPADAIWRGAIRALQEREFLQDPNPAAAFLAFTEADDRAKRFAVAVVTGLALERSMNADGYQVAAHDALAMMLELDDDATLRRYWTPTAALLGKLSKDALARIAEPYVEAAAWASWPRMQSSRLVANVLRVVTGLETGGEHVALRRGQADAAASWVHPQLRFRPIASAAAAAADEARQPEAVA